MKRSVYYIMVLTLFAFIPVITISYSIDITLTTNSIPRNLYPYHLDNNTSENPLLLAYLNQLLKDIQNMKLIVQKYDTDLAFKLNKLETLILKGDYASASLLYKDIKDDLNNLLNTLKEINFEDYLKLKELMPSNLEISGNYDISDLWRTVGGENVTAEVEFPRDMNVSIANNFFNPPIQSISPPSLSPPSIESPYLMEILVGVIVSILLIIIISSRKDLGSVLANIRKRIRFAKGVKMEEGLMHQDYVSRKYYEFLAIMSRLGFPRREWEGPIEYSKRISREFLRNLAEEMGYYFEKARYGLKTLTKSELDRIDEILKSLEAQIK